MNIHIRQVKGNLAYLTCMQTALSLHFVYYHNRKKMFFLVLLQNFKSIYVNANVIIMFML